MPLKPSHKFLSGLLTLLVIFLWFSVDGEAEPWAVKPGPGESARFQTLRSISAAFNQGYAFQVEPGIPMENHWEDPGPAFFLVCWGMVKKLLTLGPLDPFKDPYRVELAILIIPLLFLFFTKLFDLPDWFWFSAPLFFIMAALPFYTVSEFGYSKTNGLLQLSVSARWAKVPAAFWIFTCGIQIWNDFLKKSSFIKRLPAYLFIGLVLGILVSIRKDIQFTALLTLGILAFFASTGSKLRSLTTAIALIIFLFAGIFAVRFSIETAWKIRDSRYEMKDFPRIYGHPTWHTLYAALDDVIPGKLIRWGDEDPWDDIRKTPGNENIRYASKEHEIAARKLYLETIRLYPGRYTWRLARKTAVLFLGHWKLILLNALLFLAVWRRKKEIRFYAVLVSCAAIATIVPILVIPDIIYSNDFRAYLYLGIICGGLWLFRPSASEA